MGLCLQSEGPAPYPIRLARWDDVRFSISKKLVNFSLGHLARNQALQRTIHRVDIFGNLGEMSQSAGDPGPTGLVCLEQVNDVSTNLSDDNFAPLVRTTCGRRPSSTLERCAVPCPPVPGTPALATGEQTWLRKHNSANSFSGRHAPDARAVDHVNAIRMVGQEELVSVLDREDSFRHRDAL